MKKKLNKYLRRVIKKSNKIFRRKKSKSQSISKVKDISTPDKELHEHIEGSIVVAIYSTKNSKDNDAILNTKWYKYIKENKEYICYFVYANPEIESEFLNYVDSKNRNILEVKCFEKYENLSIKTYKMIDSLISLHPFNYFIKIDSSIISYSRGDYKSKFMSNIDSILENKTFLNKDYFGINFQECSYEGAINWLENEKKYTTDQYDKDYLKEVFKENVKYYSGKMYGLSYFNCLKVLDNKDKAYEFAEKIIGIEDIFIAKSVSKQNSLSIGIKTFCRSKTLNQSLNTIISSGFLFDIIIADDSTEKIKKKIKQLSKIYSLIIK